MASQAQASNIVAPYASYDEIVARAERLIPILRARGDEAERLRRVPEATREDLRTGGFARMLQPARYGGLEAEFSAVVDILPRIGRGCGSTAWCLAQYMGHAYMAAQWPLTAQEELWEDPANLLAGILIPLLGRARRVAGGYRLSGRWPFVSGVDVCDWCILSAMVEGGASAAEERYFLVRKSALTLHDTWYTVGLRGSGSHDIEVQDLYVAEHLSVTIEQLKGGPSPGNAVNTAPVYRMPSYMKFGILISSASLGMAAAIIDYYCDFMIGHTALMSGRTTRLDPTQHLKLAEARTCLAGAHALARATCAEITAHVQAGTLPNDEERTRYRAHGAHIGRQTWHIANLIWDAVMGRGVYESNPIARCYRDLATASRHFTHSWDVNGAAYGRVVLGLPLDNPAL